MKVSVGVVRLLCMDNTLHNAEKVFCVYCRYVSSHKLVTFVTKGAKAFCMTGFNNCKKALEKFHTHDTSASHQEAMLKCHSLLNPLVVVQLSSQAAQAQDVC